MNWFIIDSDQNRASELKSKVKALTTVDATHIRFLEETDSPQENSLYLIHHSDGYIDLFAGQINSLTNSFVIFYSGGGLSTNNLKASGVKIGFYSGVFQNGNEVKFINSLLELKNIIKEDNVHKQKNFQKLFGFDSILEAKLVINKYFHIHLREGKNIDEIFSLINKKEHLNILQIKGWVNFQRDYKNGIIKKDLTETLIEDYLFSEMA